MPELVNPILRDALRVILRSPDLPLPFKTRLADGMVELDRHLKEIDGPPMAFDGEAAKDYAERRLEELVLEKKTRRTR